MNTLNQPLSDRVSLKRLVLKAGAWSITSLFLGLAIRFGSNLLLTRLLVPKMFGLVAIASVVMAGLNLFSDIGLNVNIIQSRRGHDPAFLNTAWAIANLRGILLWVSGLGIALFLPSPTTSA